MEESCFSGYTQYYLITTTVHKARNLSVLNADTFIAVQFDQNSKRTSTFENSDCPFYNEYFIFEVHANQNELLKLNIIYTLFQRTCCARKNLPIGELIIDLTTVWNQPNHSFFKRWGILENPLGSGGGGSGDENNFRGYLQIDLSIFSKTDKPAPAVLQLRDYDNIDENLLLTAITGAKESEKVRYFVNIWTGCFLQKNNYVVKVQFAGIMGKTKPSLITKFPQWNQSIVFPWFYPSLAETIHIQISTSDCCSSSILSSIQVNFNDLVKDRKKFPTFGPTYLHFYDTLEKSTYIGRILLNLTVEHIDEQIFIKRKAEITEITNIPEQNFWSTEIFTIKLNLFELNFIHSLKTQFTLQLVCGEQKSNELQFHAENYEESKIKFINLSSDAIKSTIKLRINFPDNRLKFESDFLFQKFYEKFQQKFENYFQFKKKNLLKHNRKFLKLLLTEFLESLENLNLNLYFKVFKEVTLLDREIMDYRIKFNENLIESAKNLKCLLNKSDLNLEMNLKIFMRKMNIFLEQIKEICASGLHDKWPDLFINIYSSGSLMASYKTDPRKYLYHPNADCTGILCNIRHSVIFKSSMCPHTCIKCGCIFASADIALWIGTDSETSDLIPTHIMELPKDIDILMNRPTTYTCNVYIHQAKIGPQRSRHGLCDTKLQIFVGNLKCCTKICFGSLSPIWNQVITFKGLEYNQNDPKHPPMILLSLVDCNKNNKINFIIGSNYFYPVLSLASSNDINAALELNTNVIKDNIKTIYETKSPVNYSDEESETVTIPNRSTAVDIFQNLRNNITKISGKPKEFLDRKKHKINIDAINTSPPALKWITLLSNGQSTAEVLLSAELVQQSRTEDKNFQIKNDIPSEICPTMKRFRIEVLFSGIRNFTKIPNQTIGRYGIEFQFGELRLKSGISGQKHGNALNFLDPYATGCVDLPEQNEYWPSIIIKHLQFTKENNIIGAVMISNPNEFYIEQNLIVNKNMTLNVNMDPDIDIENIIMESKPLISTVKSADAMKSFQKRRKFYDFKVKNNSEEEIPMQQTKSSYGDDYTWWTKYYNSIEYNSNKHRLQIYECELENHPNFSKLQDWSLPIPLLNENSNAGSYCTLKCRIEIRESNDCNQTNSIFTSQSYSIPEIIASIHETPVFLRVYVVQGIHLRPMDKGSYSDCYIKVEYGDETISDRAHYVPNQTNPLFGKLFQIRGSVPKNQYLKISVYDRDIIKYDDLIGSTRIDIEDRLRSHHRAYCGISAEYNRIGYNAWRDLRKPSDILKQLCKKYGLGPPVYMGRRIQVAGITFSDSTTLSKNEDIVERLSLSVLHKFDSIPGVGIKLVPEHVETRSLFHDDRPGIEQGKLQMWLEIFDPNFVPPSVDLTPQPPRHFELRVIIWNTADVIMNEANIFGKKMSDIYVKCWLTDIDEAQCTDVHFRSLRGKGNFNWRMIFRFKYSMIEELMVLQKRKAIYEKFYTEYKVPPNLNIQIWDNDSISSDDFLGSTTINLSNFIKPSETAADCSSKKLKTEFQNLFFEKKVKGWFSCQGYTGQGAGGKLGTTGKIELEMEVLLENDANLAPVGLAREPPSPLPAPKRPDTSFNWYRNPFKSFKFILWPQIKKLMIYCVLFIAIILVILIVLYMLPGKVIQKTAEGIGERINV